jgi:MFS family permease
MVGKSNIPRASSISQTTAMAGMVVAPGIAGFLTAQFGVRVSLALDAASFVVVAAGGIAIKTRLHKNRSKATASAAGTATAQPSAYQVRSDRFLRSMLLISGAVMAAASIINVLIVFYVRDTFHASAETYGLIMSSWMAGLVPGALLVRRVKGISHEKILIGSFLFIAAGILGTGLAPGAWWIVPCYFVGGFGNGAQATITHIVINLRVPDTHRGRAFAALGAVSNTGPVLGYFAGGVVLQLMRPRFAFLMAGSFALLAVVFFFRGVLRNADETRTAAPPESVPAGDGAQAADEAAADEAAADETAADETGADETGADEGAPMREATPR